MSVKTYTLTQEQFDRLMDACKPVPYLVTNGSEPRSPQENANAAWASLGAELGFHAMTVRPVSGNQMQFTAESVATPQEQPS